MSPTFPDSRLTGSNPLLTIVIVVLGLGPKLLVLTQTVLWTLSFVKIKCTYSSDTGTG